MDQLSEVQKKWTDAMLRIMRGAPTGGLAAGAHGAALPIQDGSTNGSTGNTDQDAIGLMTAQVSADSSMPDEPQGKVHPKLVEMTPPANVNLPTLQQDVELVSADLQSTTKVSRSAVLKNPDYVDNFTKATLYVPTIWDMKDATKLKLNLFYSSGQPVGLPWPLLLFQWEQPAYKYGRQFGKIIPTAPDGNLLLDKNNTPSIIVAALLFKDELDKLAAKYEQIAEVTYIVGGAIASGAGHLNSIPHGSFSGGYKSKYKGPTRSGSKGGGSTPAKPKGGSSGSHTGTTPKPPTGGDTESGAPTSGATGKSSGGSGEKGRTPVKADSAKGHADDGDPGKAGGKRGNQTKADKTTAGEGKRVKTTSGSKGSEEGGEGDHKSTSNKPSDGDKPKSGGPPEKPDQPATKGGTQSAPKSVLSAEKLAKKPEASEQVRRAGQNPRELSETEIKQAKKIASVLDEVNSGKRTIEDAEKHFEGTLRLKKEMSSEYIGYREVTLASEDASGRKASVMRLLYQYDATNKKVHSVKIVQMHPQ